jgi:peroxiredoxin family protein
MSPDTAAPTRAMARPSRLSLIVYSGDADRVHYAFAMASAAAAINIPVTMFFTMGATRVLTRSGADGSPGWSGLTMADGRSGADLDADYRSRGVASFDDLIDACGALGVRFIVCEMGLRAIGLQRSALRDDLALVEGGLVTFYSEAGDAPITVI